MSPVDTSSNHELSKPDIRTDSDTRTVLLVDDDENVLRGLARLLCDKYSVLTTTSAAGAEDILAENAVDVIVCDEHMPGMSGTTFLSRVALAYPNVGRIVLTGQPDAAIWNRSISQAAIHSFLVKPCPELELTMTIRQVLKELQS